jgi:hypothetical protein
VSLATGGCASQIPFIEGTLISSFLYACPNEANEIILTENNKPSPFIDLDALINPDEYIAAAETEDELGCVLRMHLCLERFLDEFTDKVIPLEDRKFHPKRQPFSGKLSLAVAYGLAKPIAESIHTINRMRNKFAHSGGVAITAIETEKLADLVDQIPVLGHKVPSVRRMWIELVAARPGERFGFGTHGARVDFVLVCSHLLRNASGWLVIDYLRRNPSLVKYYTPRWPPAAPEKIDYFLPP